MCDILKRTLQIFHVNLILLEFLKIIYALIFACDFANFNMNDLIVYSIFLQDIHDIFYFYTQERLESRPWVFISLLGGLMYNATRELNPKQNVK
jgi:hypothetical protein